MTFSKYPDNYISANKDFHIEASVSGSNANHYILFQIQKYDGAAFQNQAETTAPVINGKAKINIREYLDALIVDFKPESGLNTKSTDQYRVIASEYFDFSTEPNDQLQGNAFNCVSFNLIDKSEDVTKARFLHELKNQVFINKDETFCIYGLFDNSEENKSIEITFYYPDDTTNTHTITDTYAKSIVIIRFDQLQSYASSTDFYKAEIKLYTASDPNSLDTLTLTKTDIRNYHELILKNQYGAWDRILAIGTREQEFSQESESVSVNDEEEILSIFYNDRSIFNIGYMNRESFLYIRNILQSGAVFFLKDNGVFTKFIIDDVSHPEHSDNNHLYFIQINAHKSERRYVRN